MCRRPAREAGEPVHSLESAFAIFGCVTEVVLMDLPRPLCRSPRVARASREPIVRRERSGLSLVKVLLPISHEVVRDKDHHECAGRAHLVIADRRHRLPILDGRAYDGSNLASRDDHCSYAGLYRSRISVDGDRARAQPAHGRGMPLGHFRGTGGFVLTLRDAGEVELSMREEPDGLLAPLI